VLRSIISRQRVRKPTSSCSVNGGTDGEGARNSVFVTARSIRYELTAANTDAPATTTAAMRTSIDVRNQDVLGFFLRLPGANRRRAIIPPCEEPSHARS